MGERGNLVRRKVTIEETRTWLGMEMPAANLRNFCQLRFTRVLVRAGCMGPDASWVEEKKALYVRSTVSVWME